MVKEFLMVKKIGFIGLGAMGSPMSKNLLKAGFDLTVWNRTESKMREIVELGAKAARSAKEVAERSEATITMLAGSADVEQVVLGKNGILEGSRPGTMMIDMSTISPSMSKYVASEVGRAGSSMLDAPVSGSVGTAAMAALTIMVGGEKKVFEAHRDILAAMGKNIFYIGANGMGCYVKLVANSIMGTYMAVIAEAMCMGAKAGVPMETMVEALKNTGAASRILDLKSPLILDGNYKAQFMLRLLFKDLGLALDAAAEESIPMPIVGLVRQLYAQAIAGGVGDDDFAAISAHAEKISKVSLKK
jgi:2-hydroxy-3-oxopropionate reductase